MTTPSPPSQPQQVPPGQQPPPPPQDPLDNPLLAVAVSGLLLTAVSAAAMIAALKLRFALTAVVWTALEGSAGVAMASPPPVTGIIGHASAQTSRMNHARRAQFVIAAAKRTVAAMREARSKGKPVLGAMKDQLATERRYYGMHKQAMWDRAAAAGRIDMEAATHGPLLGWYTKHTPTTTAECLKAHGSNFYVNDPPDIGLPGIGPHVGCRCTAGAPWPGGKLLPSRSGRRKEMAMSGARHLDLASDAWRTEARGRRGEWTGGPAYHGTTAELKPGDLIHPGHGANFDWSSPDHVYFTDEAHYGEAVRQAQRGAKRRGGSPHVYQVEPTGDAERDPDYAVSGGSFRTQQPLRVIGEDETWKADSRFAGQATRS